MNTKDIFPRVLRWLGVVAATLAWSTSGFGQATGGRFGAPKSQSVTLFGRGTSDIFLAADGESAESKEKASRQFEVMLFVPIYQAAQSSYSLVGKAQSLEFNKLVSNSDFKPVERLSAYKYGLSWSYKELDGNTWGLETSVGSASDEPFQGSDVLTVDVTLNRKYATSATTSWLLYLNYSNNRGILNNIPLPGFAYSFSNIAATQGGLVGIPFATYWWRPTAKIYASIFVFVPSTAILQSGYMFWGPLQANVKLEYSQQSYLRHGREDKKERIFYDAKKAALSLKSIFGPATFVEFEIARVFDRALFDGRNAFNWTSEKLHIPNSWQASLSAQIQF